MPNWNEGQREVLESLSDKRNILVSAAAGSGKTAVMVQRIIDTILSGDAGIDEMLVVTFTKAAAAQMKAKIINALEDVLAGLAASDMDEKEKRVLSERISEQLLLAEDAMVTTIDSFCSRIVRENFSLADMDPAFDIFDKDEVTLLKDEVLEKVLDEHYRSDEDFGRLADFMMSKNINDSDIKNYIFRVYNLAMCFADSEGWLDNAMEVYQDDTDIMLLPWVLDYKQYLDGVLMECDQIFEARQTAFGGEIDFAKQKTAEKIANAYQQFRLVIRTIRETESLTAKKAAIPKKWPAFPKKPCEEDYGEAVVKDLNKEITDIKERIKADIYTDEQIIHDVKVTDSFKKAVVTITRDFMEALMKEKKKLKKYEHGDIAHAAFNILYDLKLGTCTPTGKRKSEEYKYIYIDEYQDGSDLQENLLNAVSRPGPDGRPMNIFMVGDVKQSIYAFRQARPELFMEKSRRYGEDDGGRLITLNMNYRSRREVMDAVNFVFKDIMTKDFGGIEYNDKVALHTPPEADYGKSFPETELPTGGRAELIMISKSSDTPVPDIDFNGNDSSELSEEEKERFRENIKREAGRYSNQEIEAIEMGRRILEMVYGNEEAGIKPTYVKNKSYDPKKPVSETNIPYRRAGFGDIVILQRKKMATGIVRIFEQMNIPVLVEESVGFFEAPEIVTMLSLLRIIDNQQQDIPYASVLLSFIGGLDDSELAEVVAVSAHEKISLADKCRLFREGYMRSSDARLQTIAMKLTRLSEYLEQWIYIRPFISIAELIERISSDIDYDGYVMSLPDGRRRTANLKLLCHRAESFEASGSVGLMDFIRYIDRCSEQDIDFSEDSDTENAADSVKIMTIHKSKGLEFPIVFLTRLDGWFVFDNKKGIAASDSNYHLAFDELRVLTDGVDMKIMRPGVKKSIIRMISQKKTRTEEVRLLYVAMTRAIDKLIMVSTYTDRSSSTLLTGRSYLDYIRYCLGRNSEADIEKVMEVRDTDVYSVLGDFRKVYKKKDVDYTADVARLLEDIEKTVEDVKSSGKLSEKDNPYSFIYPRLFATKQKAKLSVSEIKHAEMEKNTVNVEDIDIKTSEADYPALPGSVSAAESGLSDAATSADPDNEARKRAAMRGTITHALFEKLDYDRVHSETDLLNEFKRVLASENYSEEEKGWVYLRGLTSFYSEDENSLFQRMKKAYRRKKLYRERQFIAGLTVDEIPGIRDKNREGTMVVEDADGIVAVDTSDDDLVVIQGIIDAYFSEGPEDAIILVDYKTDRVSSGEELLDRYASQMYLYALTLEKLTGLRVEDCILYSTRLGEVHYPDWRDYIKK